MVLFCMFFFFQAEDGIRDRNVTGVQTCALPISDLRAPVEPRVAGEGPRDPPEVEGAQELLGVRVRADEDGHVVVSPQIGRASCRERVKNSVVDASSKKKQVTDM